MDGAGTGKYKRLRNDPRVTIQACTARGKPRGNDPALAGTVEIIEVGPLFEEAQGKIRANYGWMTPVGKRVSRLQGRLNADQSFGDTVVLITLTGAWKGAGETTGRSQDQGPHRGQGIRDRGSGTGS